MNRQPLVAPFFSKKYIKYVFYYHIKRIAIYFMSFPYTNGQKGNTFKLKFKDIFESSIDSYAPIFLPSTSLSDPPLSSSLLSSY